MGTGGDVLFCECTATTRSNHGLSFDDLDSIDKGCQKEDGGVKCQLLMEMKVPEKCPFSRCSQGKLLNGYCVYIVPAWISMKKMFNACGCQILDRILFEGAS